MEFVYPFFVSFFMVFLSELGDKTQLLVLSFSTKSRARNVLLGVAIGTFFSHGLAILFGSKFASFENASFQFYAEILTYLSFLLFGILGFIPKHKNTNENSSKLSVVWFVAILLPCFLVDFLEISLTLILHSFYRMFCLSLLV